MDNKNLMNAVLTILVLCLLAKKTLARCSWDEVLHVWPLGQGIGTSDIKTNINNGTVNNVQFMPFAEGNVSYNAMMFTGTSDSYAEMAMPSYAAQNDFSISFYVYFNDTTSGTVLSFISDACNDTGSIQNDTTTIQHFSLKIVNGTFVLEVGGLCTLQFDIEIVPNVWHYIHLERDLSKDVFSIYLNGTGIQSTSDYMIKDKLLNLPGKFRLGDDLVKQNSLQGALACIQWIPQKGPCPSASVSNCDVSNWPSTTTVPPTTTTVPPTTTTVPPTTTTVPPTTTTVPPTTTTVPPTTTTVPPTTTTVPPTTTTVPPTTTTVPPTTTTVPPTTTTVPPTTTTVPPTTSTGRSTTTTVPPTTTTVTPTTTTVPPTTTIVSLTTTTVPPTTTTEPPTVVTADPTTITSVQPTTTTESPTTTTVLPTLTTVPPAISTVPPTATTVPPTSTTSQPTTTTGLSPTTTALSTVSTVPPTMTDFQATTFSGSPITTPSLSTATNVLSVTTPALSTATTVLPITTPELPTATTVPLTLATVPLTASSVPPTTMSRSLSTTTAPLLAFNEVCVRYDRSAIDATFVNQSDIIEINIVTSIAECMRLCNANVFCTRFAVNGLISSLRECKLGSNLSAAMKNATGTYMFDRV